jgi:hypothetical protein
LLCSLYHLIMHPFHIRFQCGATYNGAVSHYNERVNNTWFGEGMNIVMLCILHYVDTWMNIGEIASNFRIAGCSQQLENVFILSEKITFL